MKFIPYALAFTGEEEITKVTHTIRSSWALQVQKN